MLAIALVSLASANPEMSEIPHTIHDIYDPDSYPFKEVHKGHKFHREHCVTSEECDNYPFDICGKHDSTGLGHCDHKGVFPVEPKEMVGLGLFGVIMALLNVAGIGGGGITNPLIQFFFVFGTKQAVAVSSFTILWCSLLRYIYNWRDKNPVKPQSTLVDYNLASIMLPTTLFGS